MKQVELCEKTGIAKGTLNNWLAQRWQPKQEPIMKMAQVLDVSEMWLAGYDVPMERQKNTDEQMLTDAEKILLSLFRQVPEEMQDVVLDMVQVALKNRK